MKPLIKLTTIHVYFRMLNPVISSGRNRPGRSSPVLALKRCSLRELIMSYGLSKTKILNSIQCPKRLWLEVHKPEPAQYSETSIQIMQTGNDVHRAYRTLVPDGILIEHVDDLKTALEQTRLALKKSASAPVFEGAFQQEGVLVRADLLLVDTKGSRLVEVKAAGSVREHHLNDCAIQTWVIEREGIPIKTVELALINTSFVYPGGRDYSGLFMHTNVTEQVRTLIQQVPAWVKKCQKILNSDMPAMEDGNQCHDPYECPFFERCSVPGPDYPVKFLPYGGKVAKKLIAEGILDIRDIPENRLSSSIHERVARVTKSGTAEIHPAVTALLKRFPFPRYYLDFETVAFAVPRWPGTKPYQPIPFQWSCHLDHADGKVEHKWFLDTSGEAPTRAVADSLVKNLGRSGPIFMYTSFEKARINDLIKLVPDLAPKLRLIISRLEDLHPIVKDHYYHPRMKGSWNLKSVIECIAPEMSYTRLDEVSNGMAAQQAYLEIIDPEINAVRRKDLRKKLLEYCKLDTMAMLRITQVLQRR
jgi:hypothetical protein